ncbi:probable rRNA maturation factor [Chitinasiproducens palmae]|uniref:Endoribonuclease YbeY n=1 Tax=Chitinasiproducens palmae TaxID=1770053 RepID=A0A1H2PQ46_9BURK|nr:probable rRNA maturation factor [Chitinasiproducens palmae]
MSQPSLDLSVQFATRAFPAHRALLKRALLLRWTRAALFDDAVLTLRFVDADEGRQLNRAYRGRDYATNVLTFAYAESADEPVSGDIVLCCPVVEQEAQAQGKSLDAHYAHLIVHGVLHAQGYDHEDDQEAEEMEQIETDILRALGFADPYAVRADLGPPDGSAAPEESDPQANQDGGAAEDAASR